MISGATGNERMATIISIVPFPIMEFKPGLYPGQFDLPASHKEEPQILHVGVSQYYVEIDPDRTITVKVIPDDVARSVVDDYVTANLAYDEEKEAMPGLFWLPGKYEIPEILTKFDNELTRAKKRQKTWFLELVKMADDDWERTAQHKMISDMQRYAAKSLNLERPWIIVPKIEGNDFQKCIACASLIAKDAIVCPNCRCILNKKLYEEMTFATK